MVALPIGRVSGDGDRDVLRPQPLPKSLRIHHAGLSCRSVFNSFQTYRLKTLGSAEQVRSHLRVSEAGAPPRLVSSSDGLLGR